VYTGSGRGTKITILWAGKGGSNGIAVAGKRDLSSPKTSPNCGGRRYGPPWRRRREGSVPKVSSAMAVSLEEAVVPSPRKGLLHGVLTEGERMAEARTAGSGPASSRAGLTGQCPGKGRRPGKKGQGHHHEGRSTAPRELGDKNLSKRKKGKMGGRFLQEEK